MKASIVLAAVAAAAAFVAAPAQADLITVSAEGQVFFNGIGDPPLSGVSAGDTAIMSFQVDSNVFLDGASNTRGYEIIQSSFSLTFGGDISVGLLNPFPAGETPYFTLANGIPVSDRFWVSTSVNSPGGVPLEQTPVNFDLDIGYTGDTLSSLDIHDAIGTYDFTGLTSFSMNLWQIFPDNVVLGMDFVQLTITPAPGTLALLAPFGLFAGRRRRRR